MATGSQSFLPQQAHHHGQSGDHGGPEQGVVVAQPLLVLQDIKDHEREYPVHQQLEYQLSSFHRRSIRGRLQSSCASLGMPNPKKPVFQPCSNPEKNLIFPAH